MQMAERFKMPIITLSTPQGTYRAWAQKSGQSEAIARNLREMSHIAYRLFVPLSVKVVLAARCGDWRGR
ncbi:hypothetical protein MJ581_01060 [Escherichia coli]|nr:hypothetical protein MJ581_01060 [Escherichia coli]